MQALRISDIGPRVVKCVPRLPNWCWHSCAGAPSNWVLAMLKLCIPWMDTSTSPACIQQFWGPYDIMIWIAFKNDMYPIHGVSNQKWHNYKIKRYQESIVARGQGCQHGLFFLDRAHAARAHRLSKRNFICLMRTFGWPPACRILGSFLSCSETSDICLSEFHEIGILHV